ncbi:leucine-rich repeat and iq domain-containing protein 3 [Stylonychia lemnae]|uniref:Leucine-rich repeat and iq domain-containing protein 3 n=1 Tax=Stylonychia lemnae TaxID=5949 RepID=A0A077ZZ85_STYLE|nr:leucine-rich repeat and iq domain-containing protein 3 [Stylonychia lemnae]|eukprot:CDW75240.1 leucine-rich repeat and iq domain-containing protein 3 [Stylonychia lemnae]
MEITETSQLREIRVISLRNKNLSYCLESMLDCYNLTIAYLQGNQIQTKDLFFLSRFKHLQKIDLSNNNISQLPSKTVFYAMKNLKIVYLHDNLIAEWADMENLTGLSNIRHLTLFNNPCAQISGYRHYMVNSIQSIQALDLHIVTDEERNSKFISQNCRVDASDRFQSLSDYMKLKMPNYFQSSTAEEHLMRLDIDVYQLCRIYEKNSPIIAIQRTFRGYRERKTVKIIKKSRDDAATKVQKIFRGWFLRLKSRRELENFAIDSGLSHLLLSQQQLRELRAALLLQKYGKKFIMNQKRKKLQFQKAIRIQALIRAFILTKRSWVDAFDIYQNPPLLYYQREQAPLLQSMGYSDEYVNQAICTKYLSIRLRDPSLVQLTDKPLTNFIRMFSLNTQLRFNKPLQNGMTDVMPHHFYSNSINGDPNQKRQFKILKNRTRYNKEKYINQQKKIRKRLRNNPNYTDQYQDLMCIYFEDHKTMIDFVNQVMMYQQTIKKPFIMYFEKTLNQIASATRIQTWYRAQKEQRKLLSYKNIDFTKANLSDMQYFYFKQFLAINDFIQDKTLYLEENIYLNLTQITSQVKTHLTFPEQNLHFDVKDKNLKAVVDPLHDIIKRYKEYTLPFWLLINLYIINDNELITINFDNLMSLIHINEDMDCDIVNYHEVCTESHMPNYKLKFVRMTFRSVEEARRRAVVLGLLTYSIMSGPNVFVKLFTQEHLEDSVSSMENILKIWKLYNIAQINPGEFVQNMMKQPHQGLILSDEDIMKLKTNQDENFALHNNYVGNRMGRRQSSYNSFQSINNFTSHIPGMIRMRLKNGLGRQILMNGSQIKNIYKDKMKMLAKSITKIQRDISSAQVSSRNEKIFGLSQQPSTERGQQLSKVIIENKSQKTMRIDHQNLDYNQAKTSRQSYREQAMTLNLNTERANNHMKTQLIKKDYFKQVKMLRDMQRVKSLIKAKHNADELRSQNLELKKSLAQSTLQVLEDKRKDIENYKEQQLIFKQIYKDEEQSQKTFLQRMVSEEKFLRQKLIERQKDYDHRDKIISRITVIKQKHNHQLKKDESTRFIQSFAQAKNMIDKKIKEGIKLKIKRNEVEANKEKVKEIKGKYHKSIQREQPASAVKCEVFEPLFLEGSLSSRY